MEGAERELAPWEVPPDEAYWQALLREGEWGEEAVVSAAGPVVQDGQTGLLSDGDSGRWEVFNEYKAADRVVELQVVDFNRGGLLVEWDGVMGFVPASQLCDSLPHGDEELRREALARRVGDVLTLKVIEVDPALNRLILSERAAQRTVKPDLAVLDELNEGDVRQGYVTNLCAFGAFVDLGGVEGLIHISELSWGRVSHPADVLRSGQEVEVYVLNVDRQQGRVGLSLKRLQPDPWTDVESRYHVGQVVTGTVTNVVNFGAFVRLEEGLEGLIHVSDLTDDSLPIRRPLREGDVVQVRIMNIDGARRRLGLSLQRI